MASNLPRNMRIYGIIMLSKIALLVLSCIAEKPLNPYQLKKIFGHLNLARWFPMADSSMYAAIKMLVKNGYIAGTKARSGNMPEKTIYTITPEGRQVLERTLLAHLREHERIVSEFDVTMLFLCHLPKDVALQTLRLRRDFAIREIAGQQQAHDNLCGKIPEMGLINLRHSMYKREAELKTVTELIELIETTSEWNHFLVLDLSEENASERPSHADLSAA